MFCEVKGEIGDVSQTIGKCHLPSYILFLLRPTVKSFCNTKHFCNKYVVHILNLQTNGLNKYVELSLFKKPAESNSSTYKK